VGRHAAKNIKDLIETRCIDKYELLNKPDLVADRLEMDERVARLKNDL